jgi:hypothetical protein
MKIRPWEYEKYSSDNIEIAKKETINRKKPSSEIEDDFDFEKYNPYEVRIDPELKDGLETYKQIAFAVNPDNFNIVLSKSGHSTIMRKFGYDKHNFKGGWVFPSERKITFYSGILGKVSKKQQRLIANAISNEFGISLRMVN